MTEDPTGPIAGVENLQAETEDDNADSAGVFVGCEVVDYDPDEGLTRAAEGAAYCVGVERDSDQVFADLMARLLEDDEAPQLRALVVGNPSPDGDPNNRDAEVMGALTRAHERIPELRALFLYDITQEESEASWICPPDWAPLLQAFQHLEHVRVRGQCAGLGSLRSESLRSLTWQSAGLGQDCLRALAAAHLPALEHLELWLGRTHLYDIDLLTPLLSGNLFPSLRYLGLRNAEGADAVAEAVAVSPLLSRLEVLDLSKGTLGDQGARALLAGPEVRSLRKLDLHHHWITSGVQEQLRGLGIDVDLSLGQLEDDEDAEYVDERYASMCE